MKDKDRLKTLLNAYGLGSIDRDYTLNYILDVYKNSKMFNYHNFLTGFSLGVWIMLVLKIINII